MKTNTAKPAAIENRAKWRSQTFSVAMARIIERIKRYPTITSRSCTVSKSAEPPRSAVMLSNVINVVLSVSPIIPAETDIVRSVKS